MRYIRKYKLFENLDSDKEEIRDYLSNLEDIGFFFDFYPDDRLNPNFHKIKGYLQVEISKYSKDNPNELREVFDYNEIKSEVDRLIKLVSDKYRCEITEVTVPVIDSEDEEDELISIRIDFFN